MIDTKLFKSRGAFRSTRVVRLDWAALSGKVTSDAGKAELAALRATYSDIIKACDSAPATTPTIDWDKWEATIKTPGVVAGFKESFGKLDIAPMEDTFTAKIDAKFAESMENANTLAAASEARIKELEAELAVLDEKPLWSDVTVEEECQS